MGRPTVRLAGADRIQKQFLLSHGSAPVVRLAPADSNSRRRERMLEQRPQVRLAHRPGAQGDNALLAFDVREDDRPALLISYYYLPQWLEMRDRSVYRDWVMDSGAFSAHNSEATIDLDSYVETCRELLASDPTMVEVYALDVIGDHHASRRNADRMRELGVPAIPCFHYGSPWDVLESMARDFDKVAIGGTVGLRMKAKLAFVRECFRRVWPKRVHGFGHGSDRSLMLVPWDSVDATNWEIGPAKFGTWSGYGRSGKKQMMSVRGSNQNFISEIRHYLRMERRARTKWAKTWAASGLLEKAVK